jgi:hypothetical protein
MIFYDVYEKYRVRIKRICASINFLISIYLVRRALKK